MFVPKVPVEKYFSVQRTAFQQMGIDITSSENFFHKPWKTVVLSLAFCSVALHCGFFIFTHATQMDQMMRTFPTFLIVVLQFIKLMVFIAKRHQVVSLVKSIGLFSIKASHGEMRVIASLNTKDVHLCTMFKRVCVSTFAAGFITPLLVTLHSYWSTGKSQVYLPTLGSSPVDFKGPISYAIVYMCCFLGSYCAYHATVGVDSFYLWCSHNLVAQFRIIQLKLQDELLTSSCDVNQIALLLKRCIYFHQQVLSAVNGFQRVYRPILLFQFSLNASQICVTVFQFINGTSSLHLPHHIGFVIGVLIELMIFCYGGQQLENASEEPAWAVYEAVQWDKWPVKTKKLMLLWLMRAQKPCKLDGIFFSANFKLFLWVCRTSHTYIALLRWLDRA